jgi:hypothetical protein
MDGCRKWIGQELSELQANEDLISKSEFSKKMGSVLGRIKGKHQMEVSEERKKG